MDDSDRLPAPYPGPTAGRPLLGLTVLVVEDSRYASEALRLLCLRSGARIRRADSLRAARRHLQVYRPTAVIVDLGLPDGSGTELIRELDRAVPRISVLLGASADPGGEVETAAAGADAFLAKPITSLALFQAAILSRLPADRQPAGPRGISDEHVVPDPLALQDDFTLVASRLEDPCGADIDYIAQFVAGLAYSSNDAALADAASALARARGSGNLAGAERSQLAGVLQARLAEPRAI